MEIQYKDRVSLELIKELLTKGVSVNLIPRGASMIPFIRDREKISVQKTYMHEIKLGDIVAYECGSAIVVHRVVIISNSKGRLQVVTKGDNRYFLDHAIEANKVLGVVNRAGKRPGNINFDSKLSWLVNLAIAKYSLCLGKLIAILKGYERPVRRDLVAKRVHKLGTYLLYPFFYWFITGLCLRKNQSENKQEI